MIRVGLYGDSFGAGTSGASTLDTSQGFKHHWIVKLSKILNWDVTNYSESGSSVYEAYRNFLKHNETYDLNIVIITISGRYHNPIDLSFEKNIHLTCEPHVRDYIKHEAHQVFTKEDTELLRDLEGWYRLNSLDHFYNISITKLMYNHMKQLRPDTLFLRVNDELDLVDNYPLFDIFSEQCQMFGKNPTDPLYVGENPLLISGHFTPEIHELVADYMLTRINTGVWPEWKIPEHFKFNYTFEEYYNRH